MTAQDRITNGEVITASPVSFVVMGPKDRHRGVIARSNDANLDLIGMDDRILDWIDDKELEHLNRPSLFRRNLPLNTYIVRTGANFTIGDAKRDNRLSYLSFAWRGLASGKDVAAIDRAFSTLSADIDLAMRRNDPASVEWQIAPLILLCQRTTEKVEAKHDRRRTLFLAAGIMYAALVLAALLQYYIARLVF